MSKNWNQQLSSYVSSNVIECLEQNIKKQIEFQKTIEYETNEQSLNICIKAIKWKCKEIRGVLAVFASAKLALNYIKQAQCN